MGNSSTGEVAGPLKRGEDLFWGSPGKKGKEQTEKEVWKVTLHK